MEQQICVRQAIAGHLQYLANEFLESHKTMSFIAVQHATREKRMRQLQIANSQRVLAHRLLSAAWEVLNGHAPIHPAPSVQGLDQTGPIYVVYGDE